MRLDWTWIVLLTLPVLAIRHRIVQEIAESKT